MLCASQARVESVDLRVCMCCVLAMAHVQSVSVLCARQSVAPRCMSTVPAASLDLL